MKKLLLVAIVLVMVFYPTQTFACSVSTISFEQKVTEQDIIAIGTITEITDEEIVFQIEEYLKGSLTSPMLVTYRYKQWLSLNQEVVPEVPPTLGMAMDPSTCTGIPVPEGTPEEGQQYLMTIPPPTPNHHIQSSNEDNQPIRILRPVWLDLISNNSITVPHPGMAMREKTISLEEVRTIIKTETGAVPHKPIPLPPAELTATTFLPWVVGGVFGLLMGWGVLIMWRRRQAA